MTIDRPPFARVVLLSALACIVLFWTVTFLRAQDTLPCPNNLPCKVLVLTDEQIATLEQLVSNTAISGPYAQIHAVVQFYKDLLAKAPAGKVTSTPAATSKPEK